MRSALAVCALLAALGALGSSGVAAVHLDGGVSDNVLRASVPRGWSSSVAFGTQVVGGRGNQVAWLMIGSFPFSTSAASREGGPAVARGRVLVAIGDFLPTSDSHRLPVVRRLRIPTGSRPNLRIVWSVRFAGRALRLSVEFGSAPSVKQIARANVVLASVGRAN